MVEALYWRVPHTGVLLPSLNLALFHVNIQRFPCVFYGMTLGTIVDKGIWIVLAFNVVPNIHNCLVGELQADATGWCPTVIAHHKFDEILWAREISLNKVAC